MKKVLFLFICLLFIPVVYAKNNVSIEKIELVSKSDNVVINSDPTYSGLEMNYDIRFKEVNDSVKYKITIKNNTKKEYEIAKETMFSDSEYLKYEYEVGDTLKANKSLDVYLTITYNKEISSDNFVKGRYQENKVAVVKLLNVGKNPDTSSFNIMFVIIMSIILVLIIAILLFRHNRKIKYTLILLMGIVSIPLIVKALEEIKFTVNVNVEVVDKFKVVYRYHVVSYYKNEDDARSSTGINDVVCYSDVDYYLGEETPENIYHLCWLWVDYEEPVKHYVGDRVSVSPKDIQFYTLKDCEKVYEANNKYHLLCPVEGHKIIDSSGELYNLIYSKEKMEERGFTYGDDDDVVMNFVNPNDNGSEEWNVWNSGGVIGIDRGYLFTMPGHDVYIYDQIIY